MFHPWPSAAWSELDGTAVQLFEPEVLDAPDGPSPPGLVLEADPRSGLVIATGSGRLRLESVKPAGRARMSAAAWVRGRGVAAGQHFD